MRYKKIAMTSASKKKMIMDFLETVGLYNEKVPAESIYNETVSAMYSVMNAGGLDRDEIEQMFNLYLMGLNPSDYWTSGSIEGSKTDQAQAFLSAFSDRLLASWRQLWGNQNFVSGSDEEAKAIRKTFRQLKTTLRQRAFEEMRATLKERSRNVSMSGGNEEDDSAQAYQNAMEGEISRSVSVGDTFNLNSWDEIKAAGNKDEKVGAAVNDIIQLFSSNMSSIAKAMMDIAFEGDRKTDSFERKLFEIVNATGDYSVSVRTFADSLITIDENVAVAQPNALRSGNWARNLTKHLIVTAYPELRHLIVPDMKGTLANQKLPEDLKDLINKKHSKPFSNALISLPKSVAIRKAEIFGNSDALTVVNFFKPNIKIKNLDGVVSKGGLVACTPKMYEKLIGAATTALNQKWVKGKRARQSGYWARGMDSIVLQIKIRPEEDVTTWVDADPVPSTASRQTKVFVDSFQGDLIAILMDLNEAHGWYELRNKRYAKKKEAKLHRLASKIAFRWIQQNIKVS